MISRFRFLFFLFLCAVTFGEAWGEGLDRRDLPASERYGRYQERVEYVRDAWESLSKYEQELEKLARFCDAKGYGELAEKARALTHSPETGDKLFAVILPSEVQDPELARMGMSPKTSRSKADFEGKSDGKPKERSLKEKVESRLRKIQFTAAEHCFHLAQDAMETGHTAFAFDLLMKVLALNPDHPAARKLLGYELHEGHWLSPFEVRQARTKVYHPRYGWIPRKGAERYEQGERFVNGRWISEEEDARIHRDIERGWTVETPHFTVVTNHSLPAAVKIGEQVEVLYRVWKQLFLRYFATDAQMKALFAGKSSSGGAAQGLGAGTGGKHRIVFFRNRKDYVDYLSPRYPSVANSCGFYVIEDRTSYFFAGEEFDRATMLHEVTHQLFSELRRTSPQITERPNFWMVEGIAIHMESLHDEGQYHVVGGFDTQRLLAARIRFTKDGFYVPLRELCAMNTQEFQTHPQMVRLYSQSAGLMQFLLHSSDGRYRDAVADILREIYSGQSVMGTLPKHLGRSFEELDEEYREFISRNTEELSQWEMD